MFPEGIKWKYWPEMFFFFSITIHLEITAFNTISLYLCIFSILLLEEFAFKVSRNLKKSNMMHISIVAMPANFSGMFVRYSIIKIQNT